jgi:serine/threonine-protein kinase
MSPEQATGDREVDARSDTYALACVAYEMLTGEPPHPGSTAQAVLGRILMGEVDLPTKHRRAIPAHVESALLRALEKLPADRFASASEFAAALQNPAFRHQRSETTARQSQHGSAAGARARSAMAAVAVVSVLAAGAIGWSLARSRSPDTGVEWNRVLLGNGPQRLSELVAFRAALHPGGEGVIYADTAMRDGRTELRAWWKAHDALEPVRLEPLDGALSPTFSPDGDWLAFVQNGELRKQPLLGGNSVTLVPSVSGGTAHALAWLDNGTIVFENAGFTLYQVGEDGQGEPVLLSTEEETGQPIHMAGFPGGWGVLVSGCVNSCPAGTRLFLLDLEADTVVTLTDDVVRAWPIPGGRVLYLNRSGAVFAATLDRSTRTLGPPTPLFSGVRVSPDANGEMHVAADGRALYVRGSASAGSYAPMFVERNGRAVSVNRGSLPTQPYTALALSPDAGRLAVTIAGATGEQLWVADLAGGPLVPLTPNEASASRPHWYADGIRLAYVSLDGQRHARSIRADGTSQRPDTLVKDVVVYEVELAGVGEPFVMRVDNTAANADLYRVDPADPSSGGPLLGTPFSEYAAALSPDHRWLAYVSTVSGRPEVYIRPYPEVSSQVAVSLNGGEEPVWDPAGGTIYYRDGGGWMVAARVDVAGEAITVADRERLFDASRYAVHGGWRGYDVMPDGRFVMLAPGPGTVADVGDLVLVDRLFLHVEEALER